MAYSVLHLLEHNEYSIRESAELALNKLLALIVAQPDQHLSLFRVIESKVLILLKKSKDEMVMRTLLSVLRTLVVRASQLKAAT